MKRFETATLTLALVFGCCTAAWACDKHKAGTTGCSKTDTTAVATADTSAATAESGCPHSAAATGCSKAQTASAGADGTVGVVDARVARALSMMPQMTYQVGDFSTSCPRAAAAKSKASGEPIQYVVAGTSYTCRKSAMNKLAEAMVAAMPRLAQVQPSVDGETIACSKTAAMIAARKHTNVKYVVAGTEFSCPNHAGSVAAKVAERLKEMNGSPVAMTASAGTGCPLAAKASSGCSKGATASASNGTAAKGCCSKGKTGTATTASAGSDSGKSVGTDEVKTASKDDNVAPAKDASENDAGETKVAVDTKADAEFADTPALARAKQMVREVVQFVAADQSL